MHAANSARGEDVNSCQLRGDHRSRNRGCTRPTGRKDRSQVRAAYFCNVFRLGKKCDLFLGESNNQLPIQDTDSGRRGTRLPHRGFHRASGLQIQRPRQSVGNHSGLQRYDRLSSGNRGGYVFANCERGLQSVPPGTLMIRCRRHGPQKR